MLPLDGFRVLDLSRFLSGPYTTMVLAELGADVVKVERFPEGDDSRRLSPKVNGESYPFGMPNRSKRSLAVDLKSPRRVVTCSSGSPPSPTSIIENFRPGVVRRLGIDYDAVRDGATRHPLLLDQRLRPDRSVPGPPGLRHHGAGRDGLPADDRPARRQADQGRHRDQRHRRRRHRDLLDHGRAAGA